MHKEFNISYYDVLDEGTAGKALQVAGGIGAFHLGGPIGVAIYAAYLTLAKRYKQMAEGCNNKTSKERADCMKKVKEKEYKDKIKLVSKGKGKCKEAKNPEKCAKGADKEISKLNKKISAL